MEDEIHDRLLGILEQTPDITQRKLAATPGVSVGKPKYWLRALVKQR